MILIFWCHSSSEIWAETSFLHLYLQKKKKKKKKKTTFNVGVMWPGFFPSNYLSADSDYYISTFCLMQSGAYVVLNVAVLVRSILFPSLVKHI